MMKKIFTLAFLALFIGACEPWGYLPQPLPVWTAPPSQLPGVITATPIILAPPSIQTATQGVTILTPVTVTSTNTETPSPTATLTFTPFTPTETPTIPVQALTVDILGCNTSIDITHGMGEVTNAYVTVKNTGNTDLPNTCALLRAIDEDREHPDKKVCVPNLPVRNQVTFKLTVDSAYNNDTIIQVDASSNDLLLLRMDRQSCTDIGIFGGAPADVGVVKPIQ